MKRIILRLLHLSTNHSSIHNHTLHIYRIGGETCWIWRLDRAQVPISLWVWIQTNHLVYGVNRTSPAPLAPALWMIRVDCFISHIFLPRADSQNVLISDMEAMNPTSNLPCPLSSSTAAQPSRRSLKSISNGIRRQNARIQRGLVTHLWEPNVMWSRSGQPANEMCLNSINSNHPLAA